MDIEFLREYCLDKQHTTESTPFDQTTLVIKVCNKMFCLFSISNFVSVNLKCDPETAEELRASYNAVAPGYHMNKKHWNTITFHQDLEDNEILKWVDHSYDLVVKSLTKKQKEEFQ